MSVQNFKPTLWEGSLIANFHTNSVANALSTAPTSVKGEKVIFNRVGSGALKDYEGTVAWDEISTTPIEMTFDHRKYFAFSLDDVDKAQLKADVMSATTQEHAMILAEATDKEFFKKLVGGAKSGNTIGTTGAKIYLNAENVYDYIVDLGTILSKNKVPKSERYVTVNAEILGLLSKDARFTASPNILANGVVEGQKINGLQVVWSEELPTDKIVAHHKSAIGFAKQVGEMEAMRLQTSFADGIRGLSVFGNVILRQEAIAVLNYTLTQP